MKKHKNSLLLLPVLVALSTVNVQARGNHNGLIAGACAVGAAIFGMAAIADWCYSETDDQLIGRVGNEFHTIASQYQQTMDYFGPRAGVGIHAPHNPIQYISEDVLYEFGTFVWNNGVSHAEYRSQVWSAKHTLQSCLKDLRKRIQSLEGKYKAYEDQKRLATMRSLWKNGNKLLSDITLFADCLECHKTYFTLYDEEGNLRNKYAQEINIVTSERYTLAAELKRYILSCDSSQYAFSNFVGKLEIDISSLQSSIYNLKYNYESRRHYAQSVINYLSDIRTIIASDPRYQDELYHREQARLERQRIEALEAQARLERERIRMERERNRLMEQQIALERQRMYRQPVIITPMPVIDEVSVTVTF
jgi:hypothetical protein